LNTINLQDNPLRQLHRDIFKDNLKLTTVYLHNNKFTALHPKMVSHLSNLNHLSLSGNLCINRDFGNSPSKATIESELINCGHNYLISAIELLDSENSIDEKFNSFEKRLEEKEKKFERKFELITDLFYHLDERNEGNSKQIEEIKHMVDKIFDMLSRK
jgi:hypothetical protein